MTSDKNTERALARLCEQARAVIDPKLDARAIEAAVLMQVARSGVESKFVSRRKQRQRYLLAAAAMAAASAFVGWHLMDRARKSTYSEARAELQREPGVDGRRLLVGHTITADDHDVTVKHGNLATWRLKAPGVARVVENDARITIALERGRIDASVTPQPKPEVLAIEVEHVRVAVHGTVFSVQRRDDVADIQVSEGAVRVGSIDARGATTGSLLTAPGRLSVSVQPIEAREPTPTVGTRAKAPLPSIARGRVNGETSTHPPEPEPSIQLPERPSIAEVERIWDVAMRKVSDCFAGQTGADPSLRVSFGTQIQLRIAPDGTVSLAGFDPPVPRDVFDCAQRDVTQLRTLPTELGASTSRPRVLTR